MPSIASQYTGKTLNQIRDAGLGFRPDVLGSFLGIAENVPLSADTIYRANLPSNYQNSAEGNAFRSIFSGNDADIISRQQAAAQEKAQAARMQAIAPAVKSLEESIPEISTKFSGERTRLEAGKDPLKQRYQLVLDELKRRESVETQRESTALSREYGRRGIPLSSGVFDQGLNEKLNPITEFYGIQGKETSLAQEQSLAGVDKMIADLTGTEIETIRSVRNILGQLQSGAGNASIEDAFRTIQAAEQQRQFDQNLALQREQQEVAKRLADAQIANYNKPEKEDISKNYISIGEGNALYDLKTGKLVYTNPKTYKADDSTGTGSNSELDALRNIFGGSGTTGGGFNWGAYGLG